MTKTIIIHGQQGCGKTTHAKALAARFGCSSVVDDWNGIDPLPNGTLALTSAWRIAPPRRATVIHFDVAMAEAGLPNVTFLSAERQPVVTAAA